MHVLMSEMSTRGSCEPTSHGENVVSLQISIRQYNDVTILDLIGKSTIDAGESELLSQRLRALTDNGRRKLLLNLANLTKMDSTGICAIVE